MEIFFYLLLFIIASSVASAFGKVGRNVPPGPRWPNAPQPGTGWPPGSPPGTGGPRVDPAGAGWPRAEQEAVEEPVPIGPASADWLTAEAGADPFALNADLGDEAVDLTGSSETNSPNPQRANPQWRFEPATGIVAMEVLGRPRSLRPWRGRPH